MTTRNEITIAAPRETVWSMLCEPGCYAQWVIGAKRIRSADRTWPQPGSEFDHTVGAGPLATDDATMSLGATEQRQLILQVRFRPIGIGLVTLDLHDHKTSHTRLVLKKRFIEGPVMVLPRQLRDALSGARNWLSLHRLRRLCEQKLSSNTPLQ